MGKQQKNNNYWQPENLYIIITEDYKGYLAVNVNNRWIYLNFQKGKLININPPENILKAFNEIECLDIWDKQIIQNIYFNKYILLQAEIY